MLQAFIITLREGVEASLIVGIIFAYLSKINRPELKKTVFWALGSAIAASVLGAVILSRTQWNSDIFEGWVMLAAAAFVVSMIWFMHKTARSMKGEIEAKIAKAAANTSRLGLFFFVFLLVLREGVETVLILSAVSLNSTELLSFTGTMLGIAVSVVFGVMFIRGSVKINLQRFFRVTSVILYFVTFQLIVSGLHELSENGVLPSSTAEMRYIGPIVRNDLFFFVTMLALAMLMILMEQRRRTLGAPQVLSPETWAEQQPCPDRRRAQPGLSAAKSSGCPPSSVPASSSSSSPPPSSSTPKPRPPSVPPRPSPSSATRSPSPASEITDDHLHRYGVHVTHRRQTATAHPPKSASSSSKSPTATSSPSPTPASICGPVGFYIGSQGITCKMCASPLNPAASMGAPGGCNPIPLKSTVTAGQVTLTAADLKAVAPRFEK